MEDKDKYFVGSILGEKYRVIRHIGSGGMGAVYEAINILIERHVAIKVMSKEITSEPDSFERFRREAVAASKIGHPSICEVFDLVYDRNLGLFFIVMELLSGEPVSSLLERKGIILVSPAIKIMVQVLNGLESAHNAGIIHRDLKPENIFLVKKPDTKEVSVKILDFGISKLKSMEGDKPLTKTGALMGTPYYMSPEQACGLKGIDHRTDIYSAGAVLYKILSGKYPYEAENIMGILFQINKEPFPRVRKIAPHVPEGVEKAILKATAKDPDNRFSSAKEMREALLETLSEEERTSPLIISDDLWAETLHSGKTIPDKTALASMKTVQKQIAKKSFIIPLIVAIIAIAIIAGSVSFFKIFKDRSGVVGTGEEQNAKQNKMTLNDRSQGVSVEKVISKPASDAFSISDEVEVHEISTVSATARYPEERQKAVTISDKTSPVEKSETKKPQTKLRKDEGDKNLEIGGKKKRKKVNIDSNYNEE